MLVSVGMEDLGQKMEYRKWNTENGIQKFKYRKLNTYINLNTYRNHVHSIAISSFSSFFLFIH